MKLVIRGIGRRSAAAVIGVAFPIAMAAPGSGDRVHAQQSTGGLSPQVVAQLRALAQEKRARTPAQRKIDSQLLHASRMARGQAVAAGVTALETNVRAEPDGRVIVDVRTAVSDALLMQLRALGAEVLAVHPAHDDVQVKISLDRLEAVAALPDVRFIMPKPHVITHARRIPSAAPASRQNGVNSGRHESRESIVASLRAALGTASRQDGPVVNVGTRKSQGDRTHLAGQARGTFGVTGAGVKIGVLSNGVAGLAASQASGDLPFVTVVPGQDGSGAEGTAMLEIIHDLAPGAELFFATGTNSLSSFAQNIRDLRTVYGCDIIVDDVFWIVESPFHDGMTYTSPTNAAIITQAVKDVAASGVLYFSAAGDFFNVNDGASGTWEGDFVNGGDVSFPDVGQIHQFAPGQNHNSIGFEGLANTLKWSDPLSFSAKNDYDLFRLSSDLSTILAASTNDQTGGADPYEEVSAGAVLDRLVIIKSSGDGRFLHLSAPEGVLHLATAGAIVGHSATSAPNSFAVAATPAGTAIGPGAPSGPYPDPFNGTNVVEGFSSDGPRRMFYMEDGAAMTPGNFSSTGGIVLNKPDLTAADGVSVTGNGGFQTTFFGTSAAAPHAAAIAALIKSRPGPPLTTTDIRTALLASAIDIEAPGMDRDSGVGIVMASSALALVEHNFNPPAGDVILNGSFSSGAPDNWLQFATPDLGYIVSDVTGGVFRFYRVAPPPGTTNQAVVFQPTGVQYGPNTPLRAQFDLGNSDNVRKRISVLLVDHADFGDLAVCTFWLPPNSPLTTYQMRSHTNKAWANAAVYFYAASAGSNGGYYLLDNVSMQLNLAGSPTETECVDPQAPAPTPGGPPSAELLTNQDFSSGSLAPWIAFGTITAQVATAHASVGGTHVAEFIRPNGTPPAGVLLQATGHAMAANEIMTATFQLGNSSRALKRVTTILHDLDFSDLAACTFYLFPGQALTTYSMKAYASKTWTNATASFYAATVGTPSWIRLDNVSFKRTPATSIVGTECEEPALTTFVQSASISALPVVRPGVSQSPGWTSKGFSQSDAASAWTSVARSSEPSVLTLNEPIDLSTAIGARLTFESSLRASQSRAEVQVSLDRLTWITVAMAPESEHLEPVEVDLREFTGRLVWVRFVFDGGLQDSDKRDMWRIQNVQIRRDPLVARPRLARLRWH